MLAEEGVAMWRDIRERTGSSVVPRSGGASCGSAFEARCHLRTWACVCDVCGVCEMSEGGNVHDLLLGLGGWVEKGVDGLEGDWLTSLQH